MNLTRPVAFWIAVLAAVVVAVVLLREILLPFVAGMLLAYLLDPLATRLERLGMNRLIATLTIVGLFVVGVTALIILTAPVVVRELAYFIDSFLLYIKRVRELATDPNRPWLSKLSESVQVTLNLSRLILQIGLNQLPREQVGTMLRPTLQNDRQLRWPLLVFSNES